MDQPTRLTDAKKAASAAFFVGVNTCNFGTLFAYNSQENEQKLLFCKQN